MGALVYNPVVATKDGTDIIRGKIMNIDELLSLPSLLQLEGMREIANIIEMKKKEGN